MSLNQDTFKNLYGAHHDRLLTTITAVVRNREAAEDITSRAFVAAFEKLSEFRGESSFYTWLFAIAMNHARAGWRHNRAGALESLDGLAAQVLTEPASVEIAVERSQYQERLRRALRRVPSFHRRTLMRHCVEGCSVRLIARQDSVPVGTVLSRLFVARRHLRKAWKAVTSE